MLQVILCFNPFVPKALFLYSLKISENLTVFCCFQGLEKGYIGNERVNVALLVTTFHDSISRMFHRNKLYLVIWSPSRWNATTSLIFEMRCIPRERLQWLVDILAGHQSVCNQRRVQNPVKYLRWRFLEKIGNG